MKAYLIFMVFCLHVQAMSSANSMQHEKGHRRSTSYDSRSRASAIVRSISVPGSAPKYMEVDVICSPRKNSQHTNK